jgi:hypothetical protein
LQNKTETSSSTPGCRFSPPSSLPRSVSTRHPRGAKLVAAHPFQSFASHIRPGGSTTPRALAPALRHLETFGPLSAHADEPVRKMPRVPLICTTKLLQLAILCTVTWLSLTKQRTGVTWTWHSLLRWHAEAVRNVGCRATLLVHALAKKKQSLPLGGQPKTQRRRRHNRSAASNLRSLTGNRPAPYSTANNRNAHTAMKP